MKRAPNKENKPYITCNKCHKTISEDGTIICNQCYASIIQWRHNNIIQQVKSKVKQFKYHEHKESNSLEIGNLKPDLVNEELKTLKIIDAVVSGEKYLGTSY